MVTPINATMSFIGRSKMTYTKNIYISDVAAALITWDSGSGTAGAGTAQDWTPNEPVILRDVSIPAGPTVITALQVVRNGIPTGDTIQLSNHLNTNPLRPQLQIPFLAGLKIQAIQR